MTEHQKTTLKRKAFLNIAPMFVPLYFLFIGFLWFVFLLVYGIFGCDDACKRYRKPDVQQNQVYQQQQKPQTEGFATCGCSQ